MPSITSSPEPALYSLRDMLREEKEAEEKAPSSTPTARPDYTAHFQESSKTIAAIKMRNINAWQQFSREHPILALIVARVSSLLIRYLLLPALRLKKDYLDKTRNDSFSVINLTRQCDIFSNVTRQLKSLSHPQNEKLRTEIYNPTLFDLKQERIAKINAFFGIVLKSKDIDKLNEALKGDEEFLNDRISFKFINIVLHHRSVNSRIIQDQIQMNLKVVTEDHVQLDCCKILADPPSKKWVLHFGGNLSSYQGSLITLNRQREQDKVNVFMGNYRGVGDSGGYSTGSHDCISDAEAFYKHLVLVEGVDPKDIIIMGYSFGGGIAAQLAAMHPESHLWLDRTFTRYSDAAGEYVASYSLRCMGNLARRIVIALGWELDTQEIYRKLDPSKVTIVEHSRDRHIVGSARLGAKLKEERAKGKEDPFILISDEEVKGRCYHGDPMHRILKSTEIETLEKRMCHLLGQPTTI